MEIQYGMTVVDKNGHSLGKVNKVILDIWSGEPRKYAVRLEGKIDMVFFTPQQVDSVDSDTVKLTIGAAEIEGA